jgi:hypothetical protein
LGKVCGGNSIYNKDKNTCVCASGYVWNKDGTNCITHNKICQDLLGKNSYHNSQDNTCNCYDGYSIEGNKCEIIPTETVNIKTETKKALPSPTNNPKPTIAIKLINSPSPTKVSQEEKPEIVINDKGKTNYIVEVKNNENVVRRIINKIWKIITGIYK